MVRRILTVFGTRPEALKLVVLAARLSAEAQFEHAVCVTGQHREMLRQVLDIFGIEPRFDLKLMAGGQTLAGLTSAAVAGVAGVIETYKPDHLIVQGDTTTSLCAALAAHYAKVAVVHVEAGLRSGNLDAPWPEEANRRLISVLTQIHFAPTDGAAENLRKEAVAADRVHVTGNTGIDSLLEIDCRLQTDSALAASCATEFPFLDPALRLILVTGHRRESFGAGLRDMFRALAQLADRPDVQIVFPVHLNPAVQAPAKEILQGHRNVFLLPPLDYIQFVYLMRRAALIITDSGGIQEEAPALGRPVLVTRDVTERPEGVMAGASRLVGTETKTIVAAATELLDNPARYMEMAKPRFLYGDGKASTRICEILKRQ
jgi:UDP-N-acetylglucosamine 2-epimerase